MICSDDNPKQSRLDKPVILFIDDEIYPQGKRATGDYMIYYIHALRLAGFRVYTADGPDEAVEQLAKLAQLDLVLLDIMMPPGKLLSNEDTREGTRSGVFLADRIIAERPDVCILVLTNSKDPDVYDDLRGKRAIRQILPKVEYPPLDLVAVVKQVLGE